MTGRTCTSVLLLPTTATLLRSHSLPVCRPRGTIHSRALVAAIRLSDMVGPAPGRSYRARSPARCPRSHASHIPCKAVTPDRLKMTA
jgi:hypothetical protein